MELHFTKMQGAGNDYIYINCMDGTEIQSPESLSVYLSDRHFSVGGDGVVLILPSDKADARMRMFNLDGSEGRMCGNAIRCVGKFLYDNKIVPKLNMTIETLSGIKKLELKTQNSLVNLVKVDMGPAMLTPAEIPVSLPGDRVVDVPIQVLGKEYKITCVSMGNPHAVVFLDDVDSLDLREIGPEFENHVLFPERVNTEFIKVLDRNILKMRVWERGSGETMACGTGACAATVAAVLMGYCDKDTDIRVCLLGGDLFIRYTDEAVYLTGDCKKVFEGTIWI